MIVWLIVIAAVVVLGVAVALVGTGRLGEMPPVVNDRPKGIIPPGPVDHDFLEAVRFPTAPSGYDDRQVLDYLTLVADGSPVAEPEFDVVRSGFDMQAVDAVVDRALQLPAPSEDDVLEEPAEPRRISSGRREVGVDVETDVSEAVDTPARAVAVDEIEAEVATEGESRS